MIDPASITLASTYLWTSPSSSQRYWRVATYSDGIAAAFEPPGGSDPHLPAMAGEGFYNRHSPQQLEVADLLLAVLQRALDSLPPAMTATTIADYGASQGANSMSAIRHAIEALRASRPRGPSTRHPPARRRIRSCRRRCRTAADVMTSSGAAGSRT